MQNQVTRFLAIIDLPETVRDFFDSRQWRAQNSLNTANGLYEYEQFSEALVKGLSAAGVARPDSEKQEDALHLCRCAANRLKENIAASEALDTSSLHTLESLLIKVGDGRASSSERIENYQEILPLVTKAAPIHLANL